MLAHGLLGYVMISLSESLSCLVCLGFGPSLETICILMPLCGLLSTELHAHHILYVCSDWLRNTDETVMYDADSGIIALRDNDGFSDRIPGDFGLSIEMGLCSSDSYANHRVEIVLDDIEFIRFFAPESDLSDFLGDGLYPEQVTRHLHEIQRQLWKPQRRRLGLVTVRGPPRFRHAGKSRPMSLTPNCTFPTELFKKGRRRMVCWHKRKSLVGRKSGRQAGGRLGTACWIVPAGPRISKGRGP